MATKTTYNPADYTPEKTGFRLSIDSPVEQPAPVPAPVQQPTTPGKMSLVDFGKTIKTKFPQYANIDDTELANKILDKHPEYADKVSDPVREAVIKQKAADTEGQGDNFFQGLARPFVKAGVTGAAAIQDAWNLANGNMNAVSHTAEGYNVPGFGKVTPNKIGEDIKINKDAAGNESMSGGGFGAETLKTIGTGAEIAPWLMGAGEFTAAPKAFAAKGTLKALGREALVGAVGGATAGAGGELAKTTHEESGMDVAGRTLRGGLAGGAIGGALGVAVPAAIGAVKGLGGLARKGATAVSSAAERSAGQAADITAIRTAAQEQAATLRKIAEGQSAQFKQAAETEAANIEKAAAAKATAVQGANKSGIDQNVVDFLRTASPEDKAHNLEMFKMAKKGSEDLRFTKQPKQVPGKTILEGAHHLVTTKNQGIQETNRVLNSLDGGATDQTHLLNDFLTDMQDKGVHVVKRGNGAQMVTTGAVPEEDLPFYKAIYNRLAPGEDGTKKMSYKEMHDLRQYIFEKLDLAKARQQPFSPEVAQYGEQLRSKLLKPINEASKGAYKKSQQKIAESMTGLQDFVRLMGYKGNLANLGTKDLRAGEVAGRILGNAADRPLSVIQGVMDTAQKYGFKPKGNYQDQIRMADLLENVFGTTQTRSLRGQVGRAGADVLSEAAGAATDAAHMNVLGLGGRALKAILGKSKEEQIKALEELLTNEAAPRTVFGKK